MQWLGLSKDELLQELAEYMNLPPDREQWPIKTMENLISEANHAADDRICVLVRRMMINKA
jgi:hypothetical protein